MDASEQTSTWNDLAEMEQRIAERMAADGHFTWAAYAQGKRDVYLAAVQLVHGFDRATQALAAMWNIPGQLPGPETPYTEAAASYKEGAEAALHFIRRRLVDLVGRQHARHR